MMKYCFFILGLIYGFAALGQQKLVIKGKGNARYIEHKIGEKESLSSLGRAYGISASQLAKFNGKSPSSQLSKGGMIKIPVKLQDIQLNAQGTAVYHVVGKGENLFKIGQLYNKATVAQLRKINKLSVSTVKNGQEIIVGYLKTNIDPQPAPIVKTATPEAVVAEKKQEQIQGYHQENEAQVEVEKKTTPTIVEVKKETTVVNQLQAPDEGFFTSLYVKPDAASTQKTVSGEASTFKTISGWTDRKYYILINDIAPGTIVRITASNNKSICARVLGSLPVTKGAENLLLRMSNSAASVLDMKDAQFTVTLSFFE